MMNTGAFLVISSIVNQSMLGAMDDFGDAIIGAMKDILQSFVSMITAIPDAISAIFSGWANIINSYWYGPILAGVTLIGFLVVMYVGYFIIDIFLN